MLYTSPFRVSTLQSKEDKQHAQAAAKEVLDTLKLSKYVQPINHQFKLLKGALQAS
jgi:hypothetical protein